MPGDHNPAGLVLVASRTLDLDEKAVLGLADLDAAESVLTLARDGRGGPAQQAAILLGGLVAGCLGRAAPRWR